MIIGVRKIVYTDLILEFINIRGNVQNNYSDFEGLLHKKVSKKTFMNQDISYMNENFERKIKHCICLNNRVFDQNINCE